MEWILAVIPTRPIRIDGELYRGAEIELVATPSPPPCEGAFRLKINRESE